MAFSLEHIKSNNSSKSQQAPHKKSKLRIFGNKILAELAPEVQNSKSKNFSTCPELLFHGR